MEKPSAATVAYYESAVPDDARAKKGAMFGHPCAFVNGNMFFGTFHQTVVARVGEDRAAKLAKGKLRIFEPMPHRPWKEYVQIDAGSLPAKDVASLAVEALDWTATLPPKPAKGAKAAKATTQAKASKATGAKKATAAPAAKKAAGTRTARKAAGTPAAKRATTATPAGKKPAAKKR
jgi:hypothetical protein